VKVTDNKVVLFVDLLGFASLTEAHGIDLDDVRARSMPISPDSLGRLLASRDNPLTETFTHFHRCLKAAIDLGKMKHPLTAITFSDSAFVATTHLVEAANVAVDLLRWLMPSRVPVRIGIGYGTFEAVRFRSDVTVDGGDHAAHFLGTGVVRSHAAEKCGIKGIRLLLHPSVVPLLTDPVHNSALPHENQFRYLECSVQESANATGVQYEIDWWRFAVTAEARAWQALQDMWDAAPQFAQVHYQATAEAINRMRVKQGKVAINDLRRRSLRRSSGQKH